MSGIIEGVEVNVEAIHLRRGGGNATSTQVRVPLPGGPKLSTFGTDRRPLPVGEAAGRYAWDDDQTSDLLGMLDRRTRAALRACTDAGLEVTSDGEHLSVFVPDVRFMDRIELAIRSAVAVAGSWSDGASTQGRLGRIVSDESEDPSIRARALLGLANEFSGFRVTASALEAATLGPPLLRAVALALQGERDAAAFETLLSELEAATAGTALDLIGDVDAELAAELTRRRSRSSGALGVPEQIGSGLSVTAQPAGRLEVAAVVPQQASVSDEL